MDKHSSTGPRSGSHASTSWRDASRPAASYGELQQLVDEVYADAPNGAVSRLDVLVRAEIDDLEDDLIEVVNLLPAGTYKRGRLCDQLNSIITAHGWGYVYGTVE